MADHEWVHLTDEQLAADAELVEAIDRFQAPNLPAGEAAEHWLKESALREMDRVATYVLIHRGEVGAFYSLRMGEAELRTSHRESVGGSHPRLGAVLIVWLARAREAHVNAGTILRHAVGLGQIAARNVGAVVIALDPYDAATERFWRERFGFRASLTRRRDASGEERARLWLPLFPGG